MRHRSIVLRLSLLALSAAAVVALNSRPAAAQDVLPVWQVVKTGATPENARLLAEFYKLSYVPLQENGTLLFVDPDRFQRVPTVSGEQGEDKESGLPTVSQAFDMDALGRIQPISGSLALSRTRDGVRASGLSLAFGSYLIGNSLVEMLSTQGEVIQRTALDTQVNWRFLLPYGDLKYQLVGPGADAKFTFDPQGQITQLSYANRTLKQGPLVRIIPPTEMDQRVHERFYREFIIGGRKIVGVRLLKRLGYYAPSLDNREVSTIIPHYIYDARLSISGQQAVQLRRIVVPATDDAVAPQASLSAGPQSGEVRGAVQVSGGKPPYRYEWSSARVPASRMRTYGPYVRYVPAVRETAQKDLLTVTVTDANGVSVTVNQIVPLPRRQQTYSVADFFSPQKTASSGGVNAVGPVDAGTEWIGQSQGLPGSSGNANGFANRMSANGVPIRFNWGDLNAYEQDFKEPGIGTGDDSDWVDNVDCVFYTGHANGDLFTFASAHQDGNLHYSEARWGNRDLEWIGIAACGPLQSTSGGLSWATRWGPAFQGLHLLCGYQTITFDNTVEGTIFADYMHGRPFFFITLPPLTVRQAWMCMGIDVQGPSERVAVMGVTGPNGQTNINDYFWGRGATGPDITTITGYWMVSSPC